jgi:hypothetical protein
MLVVLPRHRVLEDGPWFFRVCYASGMNRVISRDIT